MKRNVDLFHIFFVYLLRRARAISICAVPTESRDSNFQMMFASLRVCIFYHAILPRNEVVITFHAEAQHTDPRNKIFTLANSFIPQNMFESSPLFTGQTEHLKFYEMRVFNFTRIRVAVGNQITWINEHNFVVTFIPSGPPVECFQLYNSFVAGQLNRIFSSAVFARIDIN